MKSVSAARRASAMVALAAVVAVFAVALVGPIQRPLLLLVTIACLAVAVSAAAYLITRTGGRRLSAAVVAVTALAAPLVLLVVYGQLVQLLLLTAMAALAGAAARYGLGRDMASLRSGRRRERRSGRARGRSC